MATHILDLRIPSLLLGDFNCLLYFSDKMGGKPFYIDHDVKEFRNFVSSNGLIDLGFVGPKFTWCNNQKHMVRVWECLDRGFVLKNWFD